MSSQNLTNFLAKVEAVFVDVTTVDVLTFTGDLSGIVDTKKDDAGKVVSRDIQWANLKKLHPDLVKGEIKLAAATHIDFDYDVVNFRAEGLSDDLRDLHNEAVKTSLEARRAFVGMFVDLLK